MNLEEWKTISDFLSLWQQHMEYYQEYQENQYEEKPDGMTRFEITKCKIWRNLLNEMQRWSDNQYAKSD